MRMQEGKQFFVNRLTFTGNTTTHDNVIRREVRLVEDGVFNTEALKYSVKRLNQLGYFKPLEGGSKDVDVQKTPGTDNKVDVKLKLEEQNRNQLTFGAGVSEFEGFFGQMSFSTSNFMGRGESLTLSVQSGSRAQNYQVSFTEPFLFDRNITGGANVFRRDIRYVGQFTQESTGGVLSFGFPLGQRLHAHVHELQLRARAGHRDQRRLHRSAGAGAQPVSARFAAHRRRRRADHQQGGPEHHPQHGRQPDHADDRQALHAVGGSGRARRQHELLQAGARERGLLEAEQPDVARLSRPVGVHPLVQRVEGAADLREAVPRRRIQRPRVRHPDHRPAGSRRPASCSAATRASSSTSRS